jgi:uncharacterized protein (DUF4415 family)
MQDWSLLFGLNAEVIAGESSACEMPPQKRDVIMKQKWVDPDDAPPLRREDLRAPGARWRIGEKVVTAEEGKEAFRKAFRSGKTRINMHLDNDIIAEFKTRAGAAGGYQTRINAALRECIANTPADAIIDATSHSTIADLRTEMSRLSEATRLMAEQQRALLVAIGNLHRFHSMAAGAAAGGSLTSTFSAGSNSPAAPSPSVNTIQGSNWAGSTH